MPALGLGTWELTGARCQRVVERALELGYRHVDTARGYENEADVGRALRQAALPRHELFLTSKVWPDHLVETRGCIQDSLDRLGVEQLDLLLLHWPSPTLPLEVTLEALTRCLERGQARRVGVSNFPPRLLRRAVALARAPLACNQIELHPFLDQTKLLSVCHELGVVVTAYSPLARGAVEQSATLGALAARRNKAAAQIALRWLLQRGVCAIPKASSDAHLRANLAVLDFELSQEEMQQLDRLNRGQRQRWFNPEFAPDWDH